MRLRPSPLLSRVLATGVAAILLAPAAARADLPMATFPECGEVDRPDLCPVDLRERWEHLSYVRADLRDQVRPQELDMGSGLWLDRALRLTAGDWGTVIAVLDSGAWWSRTEVRRKYFLNRGELPAPQWADGSGGGGDDPYDLDGNGIFNIDDYLDDPRVDWAAGSDPDSATWLDPGDLIHTFSDGVDDDGNGYIDDVSGWDFFWNDNDPYDEAHDGHGYGEMSDSSAEGNDEGNIGTCPNCAALPLRVSDSFVADVNNFALAAAYAVDMGASVIQEALGTINNTTLAMEAIEYAYRNGVTVIASAADETSYHANYPGANEHTVYVHAVRYDTDDLEDATTFLNYSNCTNHGPRLQLSAPKTTCSSGATGVTAGVTGLIYSHAREVGLTPALSANEVQQILVHSVQDIDVEESRPNGNDPDKYPSKPGWDRYFGYGRVNAYGAVLMVDEGRIPPEADVTSPRWFEVLDPERTPTVDVVGYADARRAERFDWSVEVAVGDEPDEEDFEAVADGAGETEARDGVLATLDLGQLALDPAAWMEAYTPEDDNVTKADKAHAFAVTVRLRVVDEDGNRGEMRKVFFVRHDPDLLPGFPVYLGPSAAGLQLHDLDGDGVDEVVYVTSDGDVHVAEADPQGLVDREGWPQRTSLLDELDPALPGANHRAAPAFAEGHVGSDHRHSVFALPAIGDLEGDGVDDVVVATLNGEVAAWDAAGVPKPGFPIRLDPSRIEPATPGNVVDYGFFGSPVLYDLDGDGDLEIVAASMDQYVNAWHHDGTPVSGWPVLVRYFDPVDGDYQRARIISTPAVGDIDADGIPDVVVGTNENAGSTYGLCYAIHGDGEDHPGGAIREGWPVFMFGAYTNALPYVGQGTPGSPALADLDGDGTLEIAANTIADPGAIYRHDGGLYGRLVSVASDFGALSNTDEGGAALLMIHSGSFGDVDGDGALDFASASSGFEYASGLVDDGRRHDHDHLVGVWSGKDLDYLDAFPRIMEDIQFFTVPVLADLDGDGGAEVIQGSGGYMLHAFRADGVEPSGWPKFTGQWILGSGAVGEVDGDGRLDVVVGTRQGWLFAFRTAGTAHRSYRPWPGMNHDPANTRNAATPLPDYPEILDIDEEPEGDDPPAEEGCSCEAAAGGPGGGAWAAWALAVLAGTRRRR